MHTAGGSDRPPDELAEERSQPGLQLLESDAMAEHSEPWAP